MNRKHTLTILLTLLALTLALGACTPAAPAAEAPAGATEEPAAEEAFQVTVVDGLGTEVTLDARPQRIASMTLGTDELLLDLVGPERLAAITYLASDATTSNIADRPELAQIEAVIQPNPSPEQIIELEPDLVFVASFTDATVIEQLRGAGLNVFATSFFSSIDAMQQNILDIGELVGETARAEEIVAQMGAQLDAVAAALQGAEETPSVVYLSTGGWVAGSATTVDDIIQRAGGTNAAADLVDWNQVSEEALIELNPDVVVLSPYVTDEEFLANPAYSGMAAIENGRVFSISDAYMSATSQYLVRGVEVLAHRLHPDLVPAPEYLPEG